MKSPQGLSLLQKLLIGTRTSALILAIGVPAWAQTSEESEEEIYELSPFSVSAEGSIGYQAGNTLAGTRLNVPLRDIASAVQVLTKDFLDDTGATAFDELLTYTTGTEAYGVSGSATFGELGGGTNRMERARREPQLNTRVRGMSKADLARDYFISDVAFDPYNTGTVTINRGPNASLFGLGSPGGIINSTIDEAQTHRDFGELNFKYDEFGTVRTSINYNKVLIEDRLAIRVAILDSNKDYEQEHAFFDEVRHFVAGTWRPLENMIIRANYEQGDGDGSRPNLGLPTDRITPWFENGKFLYNPITTEWFRDGALVTDPKMITELAGLTRQLGDMARNGHPMTIFDDPNSPMAGNNGYAVIQAGVRRNQAGRTEASFPDNPLAASGAMQDIWMRMGNGVRALYARDPNYIVGTRPDIPAGERRFYFDPQITDRNIFDYRKHSLTGPSSIHQQDFNVKNISLEQTWLDNNLGIELSYYDQYWVANLSEANAASSANQLSVDINTVMLDGSPNPNVGRPIIGGRGYTQSRVRIRESTQVIGFAKYDFQEGRDEGGWLRHLGRHTLTAVFQDQSYSELLPNRPHAAGGPSFYDNVAWGGPGTAQAEEWGASPRWRGRIRRANYQALGPSMLNANSIQDIIIQGVSVRQTPHSTDNALLWNAFGDPGRMEKQSIEFETYWENKDNPNQAFNWFNPRSHETIESKVAVLQSHFLGDNLVTTASWRTDAVTQASGVSPLDPATGWHLNGLPDLDDPFVEVEEDSTSIGAVYHLPDNWTPQGTGLSVHYVDSSNFSAGAQGFTTFNEAAPLQTGVTQEYGLLLSILDERLHFRFNKFQTNQENEVITGTIPGPYNSMKLVMENNTRAQLDAAGWDVRYDGTKSTSTIFKPGFLEAAKFRPMDVGVPNNETTWIAEAHAGSPMNVFQDTNSEGEEYEISYAPTNNWRLHFNAAKAVVKVANVMTDLAEENIRIANEIFLHPQMGELFIVPDPYLPDGTIRENARLKDRAGPLITATAVKTAPQGGTLPEVRKWRWNLVTNYEFDSDHGWLSGFEVGAGVRWQDDVIIGSAFKEVDGNYLPNHDLQYFGPTETNIDTWVTYKTRVLDDYLLRLQLRIRNITTNDDPIPAKSNPDGTVALWRIGPPRWVEFSARLLF